MIETDIMNNSNDRTSNDTPDNWEKYRKLLRGLPATEMSQHSVELMQANLQSRINGPIASMPRFRRRITVIAGGIAALVVVLVIGFNSGYLYNSTEQSAPVRVTAPDPEKPHTVRHRARRLPVPVIPRATMDTNPRIPPSLRPVHPSIPPSPPVTTGGARTAPHHQVQSPARQ